MLRQLNGFEQVLNDLTKDQVEMNRKLEKGNTVALNAVTLASPAKPIVPNSTSEPVITYFTGPAKYTHNKLKYQNPNDTGSSKNHRTPTKSRGENGDPGRS
jgi:hypothetical protein